MLVQLVWELFVQQVKHSKSVQSISLFRAMGDYSDRSWKSSSDDWKGAAWGEGYEKRISKEIETPNQLMFLATRLLDTWDV